MFGVHECTLIGIGKLQGGRRSLAMPHKDCWQMGQVAFWVSHLSTQSRWNWWLQGRRCRTAPGEKSSRQIGHLHSLSGPTPEAPTITVGRCSICCVLAPVGNKKRSHQMHVTSQTDLQHETGTDSAGSTIAASSSIMHLDLWRCKHWPVHQRGNAI